MERCSICQKEKSFLSKSLKICLNCIREKPKLAFPFIKKAHTEVREKYNLPPFPPKTKGGIKCNICQNQCQIGEGQKRILRIEKK